jgi:2-phospho-L-lactate guanylyltransferase
MAADCQHGAPRAAVQRQASFLTALATITLMQATVRGFDQSDGSGSVFFDDGSVAEFGPDVFAASGLRLLRRGQRVAVRCGRSGAITAITLATLPLPAAVDGETAQS